MRKKMEGGGRVVRERFGVDPDTCTGDHSCISRRAALRSRWRPIDPQWRSRAR
jgi:NAD-dependent dihydropyrimidine dehydrogenase PreA subunit